MERVRRYFKLRRWRKVVACFLTCCIFLNTSLPVAMATPTPTGGGFTVGIGTITQDGNTTTVGVGQIQSVIEWDSLNTLGGAIDKRETLAFLQGDRTNCAVLNRVSGSMTKFGGDLVGQGMRIFIVNPAGIMFEKGATVNVTQLVASGLGMTNEAFNNYITDPVNNQMVFLDGNGEVINEALIKADSVYLVGKKVDNLGSIVAPDGLVVMAAGDEVRLYQDGSNVSIVVNSAGDGFINPDVSNSGDVTVDNGKIVLAAGDNLSRAISNVGTLAASSGEVEIHAALIDNRGQIDVSVSPSSADGDGGSISLTGTEQVVIGEGNTGITGEMHADAGDNGNGGTITINVPGTETVEGKVTIEENTLITANGGSGSGNGGSVTITSDSFEIAGDIDASFGNKMSGDVMSEPGRLEINSRNVIIADGANAGALNTIYEEDIEALSQAGTSLIVNAEEGITVKDITDGSGPGEITGRFGSIELHATGENSAVSFAEDEDTIRTTLGDIVIEAGSGGINAGNLITGKDLSDGQPASGQIKLATHNGGDITTGDLIIRGGWGHAEINVDSAGDLTVNGDVIVGEVESPILTVPNERAAEAIVYLGADDNVILNGSVQARAYGTEEDGDASTTKAYIDIIAGRNHNETGDAAINGDILAEATASSTGKADAIIKVDAWGNITFAEGAEAHAITDNEVAEAGPGTEDDEDTSEGGNHAQIIINAQVYPTVPPIGIADNFSTPKAIAVEIDVLANDTQGGVPLVDGAISSYTEPTAGTLTEIKAGDKILGFTYNPPEDFSTLTFNESGEATVTFTYTGEDADRVASENPTTVTITLTNSLPTAIKDDVKTDYGKPFSGNVLTNDIDADLADVLTVVAGTITTENGTLVLNENGTFTYTPNEGFVGIDKFTYAVTDSLNTSSEVEVTILVSAAPPTQPAGPYIQPAPGLERMNIEIQTSGCPGLVKWVAEEIGIDQRMVQIWISNSLASTGDIQPCDACAKLKNSAHILKDTDGSHVAALSQVINQFVSNNMPPTEEQMASIAEAIARNTDEDSYYAVAGEYLEALVTYIDVLNNDMGFSTVESIQFVTDKYVGRLAQGDNVGVATFIAASLVALGG